ncbi:MAG: Bcr/CflA family efflux MFS transporter [Betaproteobacteria bacterium]|nr:MAG: Bcr/CflA family efflux MFS transporter [Betaproteobacteria bacterium]
MRRGPNRRFLVTLASISLIGPLAIHMFLPAMPVIKSVFAISDALVGLTYSAALLVMAVSTLMYGSLSDRYGRRPVLLVGLALFTLGSGVSGIADSVYGLIAGRVIQAFGAGCGVTLARAIARDAYGTEGLVKVIAYLTMAYTLGPMLATLFGGMLIDLAGWRSLFWLAAIAGVLITTASRVVLYETRPKEDTQRKPSGFLQDYVALFSHARFTAFVLQTGFSSGLFYAMAAASSFLMKDYLGRSATEFGAYFMAFPIGFFLGNLLSSRVSQRFGIEDMVVAGSLISFLAVLLQTASILAGYLSPLVIFIPAFLISFGQGTALANAQVGAIRVIPSLSGTAAGIGVFFQMFLGAVFAQIYSLLADGTPIPMVAIVLTGSILALVAGLVPFVLKQRGGGVQDGS